MKSEWLETTLSACDCMSGPMISVEVQYLRAHLKELKRLRKRESLASPREPSIDGVCRCGGIPQTDMNGTCFRCKGKVSSLEDF